MAESPLFTLNNISFIPNGQSVLQEISLQINTGCFLGIIGPSGSGKSTLLRLFNGLSSPSAGTIRYFNQDLDDFPVESLRQEVGMVFQSAVMVDGTVRDNLLLRYTWDYRTDAPDDEQLESLLERVNLSPEYLKKDARTLSGGEKQRIALARVLLNEPRVLLLDEPTVNLDPQLARKILSLIHTIYKQEALTVIMVSHDHQLLRRFINRVAFLIDGSIVETGGVELLENPRSDLARKFLHHEEGDE